MKILKNTLWLFAILTMLACSSDTDEEITENPDNQDLVNENTSMTPFEVEILRLINNHRDSQGFTLLTPNTTAYNIALVHTNYMIERREISHDNFSGRSDDLVQQLNARSVGENVAFGYPTAESVVQGWLDSSGHRRNIEGDYTHTAIVARKNSGGTYYYTNLFYR